MDNNHIATLKDYQSSVERSFGKIKSNCDGFNSKDASQQKTIMNSLRQDQESAKTNINLMKMEVSNLTDERNLTTWQDHIKNYQAQFELLKKEIVNKKTDMKTDLLTEEDIKVDINKMTVQQAFDHGDNILKNDRDAIGRMIKVAGGDLDTMKEVNKQLVEQSDKLDVVDDDLKEIDYSLKRAAEQIKSMFKIYATDKLIMCMIVVILLIVIAIIICAAVGDKKSVPKTPTDVFDKNSTTTTTTSAGHYNMLDWSMEWIIAGLLIGI